MADHNKIIPFIKKWEGGWSDDPVDNGGPTMAGITLTTYVSYCKKVNKPIPDKEALHTITQEEWDAIFKNMYWDVVKGDAIVNQSIANTIVDWYWMSGITAIKRVQNIVGVTTDGIIGPRSLLAINEFNNSRDLFFQIQSARINHVESIVKYAPQQRKYLAGWKNRIMALKYDE